MIPLSKYARIKDRYCVAYFGQNDEYLVQLLFARSFIERELPGVQLYVGCRNGASGVVGRDPRLIEYDELSSRKDDFAHLREIRCNMRDHPVYQIVRESNIPIRGTQETAYATNVCLIVPTGLLPTKDMPETEIVRFKKEADRRGFDVAIGSHPAPGWVVGVESVPLFQAAAKGIKTTLYPSGLGTKLYQEWFPAGELVKI